MPLRDEPTLDPSALGVGGGHYHPKHGDRTLRDGQRFGHLVPDYALDEITDELLDQAIAQSNADRILLDGRHTKAAHRARVEAAAARAGLPIEPA